MWFVAPYILARARMARPYWGNEFFGGAEEGPEAMARMSAAKGMKALEALAPLSAMKGKGKGKDNREDESSSEDESQPDKKKAQKEGDKGTEALEALAPTGAGKSKGAGKGGATPAPLSAVKGKGKGKDDEEDESSSEAESETDKKKAKKEKKEKKDKKDKKDKKAKKGEKTGKGETENAKKGQGDKGGRELQKLAEMAEAPAPADPGASADMVDTTSPDWLARAAKLHYPDKPFMHNTAFWELFNSQYEPDAAKDEARALQPPGPPTWPGRRYVDPKHLQAQATSREDSWADRRVGHARSCGWAAPTLRE